MPNRLQATVAFPYAGVSLKTGDVFEASDKDAALLKLVGRAKDAPPVVPPSRFLRTRDLEAETADAEPTDGPVPRVKRKYTRRDMTAEP